MAFNAGDVVLVPFPYRDRLAERARPAVVVSAGLKLPSTVRMLLATVASARILLHIGHLTERDWTQVQTRLHMVFT